MPLSAKKRTPVTGNDGGRKNTSTTEANLPQTSPVDKGATCAALSQAMRLSGGPFQFLPLVARGKKPYHGNWTARTFTPADFKPHDNVGVKTGKCSGWLVDVDLDGLNHDLANAILPTTNAMFGRSSAPASHRLYVAPGTDGVSLEIPEALAHFCPPGTKAKIIELFADDHQTMMPGSTHPSGERVEWEATNPRPSHVEAADLRVAVFRYAAAYIVVLAWDQFEGQHNDLCLALAGTLKRNGWSASEVTNYLAAICRAAGASEHETLAKKRAQHTAKKERVTGAKKLREILGEDLFGQIAEWLGLEVSRPVNLSLTHHEQAKRFSEENADQLRYCEKHGSWIAWGKTHWRPDETRVTQAMVREHLEKVAREQNETTAAVKRLLDKPFVDAVDQLARSDRRSAVTPDDLDQDPMLLNTPAGTVDLRTGTMRQHDPTDMITKCTAVPPKAGKPTRWEKFLYEITGGDAESVAYLQRVAGYFLTGLTREDALFVFYGPGGNGKGTFLRTLLGILKDYGKTAPLDAFTYTKHARHTTDIAGLHGARLVVTNETEAGKSFDEAKVKQLTGSDKVSARFLYCDNFEYIPTYKIVIAGNNRPHIRNVDDAWRRRLHLILFKVKYVDESKVQKGDMKADKLLSESLKSEWPQILQWAIEGCLAWQRMGLAPPKAVLKATDEYIEDEDTLGSWIREECVIGKAASKQGRIKASMLFAAYKLWCAENNAEWSSGKMFGQKLSRVPGVKRKKGNDGVYYTGIALVKRDENAPFGYRDDGLPRGSSMT
jgi:putative DNA primase/helicase